MGLNMDTYSNRKSWGLLRKLCCNNSNNNLDKPAIHPNKIANRIVDILFRVPNDKAHSKSKKNIFGRAQSNQPKDLKKIFITRN